MASSEEKLCIVAFANDNNTLGDEIGSNGCHAADFTAIGLCGAFAYVSLMARLYTCLCSVPRIKTSNVQTSGRGRLTGHTAIWLFMIFLLLNSAIALSELLVIYSKQGPLFPVSLVEGLLDIISAVMVPLHFDAAEEKISEELGGGGARWTVAPLLIYFISLSCLQGFRWIFVLEAKGFAWWHLRSVVTGVSSVLNALLFLVVTSALARREFLSRRHPSWPKRGRGERKEQVYKYDEASFLSRMTFSWMIPLVKLGYRTPLEKEDLCALPENEKAKLQYQAMKGLVENTGILKACLSMNAKLILSGGVFRLLADTFGFAGALSIKLIVDAMSEDTTATQEHLNTTDLWRSKSITPTPSYALSLGEYFSNSFVIAMLILLAAVGQGSFSQSSSHLMTLAGMRAKNALHVLLFEKALRLPMGARPPEKDSPESDNAVGSEGACSESEEEAAVAAANEGNIDIGYITNLASDDIMNIREFIWNIHYIWALPLKVIVIIAFLYLKMGVSGAVGVVIGILVIVPLQFLTGKAMSDNNKRIFSAQDARLFKSTETMQGMKTVKLGCLEGARLRTIGEARQEELKYLRRDSFFWSVMAFLASVSTIIVATVTVGLYVVVEEVHFSAANIFTALALLGQLTVCLSVFPVTIPIFIKGVVSRQRLKEFFSRAEVSIYKEKSAEVKKAESASKEIDDKECDDEDDKGEESNDEGEQEEDQDSAASKTPESTNPSSCRVPSFPEVALSVRGGYFAWPRTSSCVLKDISMEVRSGTLNAVVGPSGSGKTALVSALLEEMERMRGHVEWSLPSAMALTGQSPWMLNASVRDNVLLGRPFKEKRYRKVLSACDLNADIDILPQKDETEVGERGVLLSGGQRQRLAIARCLYSKAACTFLDAPFSSLDSHIASHIFHEGILGILLKRRRTVVIVTDREDFLQRADKVFYLREGRIADQGKMADLLKAHPELKMSVRDIMSRSPSLFDNGSVGGLVEGKTVQERWKLLKNVTRLTIYMKQAQREGRSMGANERISPVGSHRSIVAKRISSQSGKLARRWLRTDSQMSIFHDIMLPSDEVSEDSGLVHNSPRLSPKHKPLSAMSSLGRHRRMGFERASSSLSWSTTFNSSLRRKQPPPVNHLDRNRSAQSSVSRRPPVIGGAGGGGGGTMREAALLNNTSVHPLRNASQSGAGEFQRMTSLRHLMRLKGIGSNSNGNGGGNEDSFDSGGGGSNFFQFPGLPRSLSRNSSIDDGPGSVKIGLGGGRKTGIFRSTSTDSSMSQVSGFSDDFYDDEEEDDGLILSREIEDSERREYGQIGVNVYAEYFRAGGVHFAAVFLALSLAMQCLKVYMDFLLRDWSLDAGAYSNMSYFSIYLSTSLTVLALSCSANIIGQVIGARARTKLHEDMIKKLVRCPLQMFEAYPIGRIINRFSYDMFVIDQKLPSSIQRLVLVGLICASALIVNAIQSPLFIVFAVVMVGVYWWLQHFYRCTSRELQRLESISRTPVLSHFSDTLGGLVTVRAFREQDKFVNQLCDKIDKNTVACLVLQSGCRWLGVTLDYTGAVMVFASVVINLAMGHWNSDGRTSAASIGLSLNYSLLVPIYLAWVVKFVADIENYMNAVERILQYTGLESEVDLEPRVDEEGTPEEQNPLELTEGRIKLENVSLSHSVDMRAVISGLNLEIPAGQKVGICGRSGSGKSTLLLGLSRVAKLLYGSITVDDQDIRRVELARLRSFAWSVPQNVTLFSGTVRSNLDPGSQFSDREIWQALEKIGLGNMVRCDMDNGIDSEVVGNGDNFSHGQKQELSLARAVLLQPKILLLDETTSALDASREVRLHKLLLSALSSTTLIAVTHRLANIISYDRVLVMGDGRILEDGEPRKLLKKPMGFFSALWRAAGEKPL